MFFASKKYQSHVALGLAVLTESETCESQLAAAFDVFDGHVTELPALAAQLKPAAVAAASKPAVLAAAPKPAVLAATSKPAVLAAASKPAAMVAASKPAVVLSAAPKPAAALAAASKFAVLAAAPKPAALMIAAPKPATVAVAAPKPAAAVAAAPKPAAAALDVATLEPAVLIAAIRLSSPILTLTAQCHMSSVVCAVGVETTYSCCSMGCVGRILSLYGLSPTGSQYVPQGGEIGSCESHLAVTNNCSEPPALAALACDLKLPAVAACSSQLPELAACGLNLPAMSACSELPAVAACYPQLPALAVGSKLPALATGCFIRGGALGNGDASNCFDNSALTAMAGSRLMMLFFRPLLVDASNGVLVTALCGKLVIHVALALPALAADSELPALADDPMLPALTVDSVLPAPLVADPSLFAPMAAGQTLLALAAGTTVFAPLAADCLLIQCCLHHWQLM